MPSKGFSPGAPATSGRRPHTRSRAGTQALSPGLPLTRRYSRIAAHTPARPQTPSAVATQAQAQPSSTANNQSHPQTSDQPVLQAQSQAPNSATAPMQAKSSRSPSASHPSQSNLTPNAATRNSSPSYSSDSHSSSSSSSSMCFSSNGKGYASSPDGSSNSQSSGHRVSSLSSNEPDGPAPWIVALEEITLSVPRRRLYQPSFLNILFQRIDASFWSHVNLTLMWAAIILTFYVWFGLENNISLQEIFYTMPVSMVVVLTHVCVRNLKILYSSWQYFLYTIGAKRRAMPSTPPSTPFFAWAEHFQLSLPDPTRIPSNLAMRQHYVSLRDEDQEIWYQKWCQQMEEWDRGTSTARVHGRRAAHELLMSHHPHVTLICTVARNFLWVALVLSGPPFEQEYIRIFQLLATMLMVHLAEALYVWVGRIRLVHQQTSDRALQTSEDVMQEELSAHWVGMVVLSLPVVLRIVASRLWTLCVRPANDDIGPAFLRPLGWNLTTFSDGTLDCEGPIVREWRRRFVQRVQEVGAMKIAQVTLAGLLLSFILTWEQRRGRAGQLWGQQA